MPAGRPRTPKIPTIKPPLTTSMTFPSTGSPDSAAPSMRALHARNGGARLSRHPGLGQDEGIEFLAELNLVGRGRRSRRIDSSLSGITPCRLVADVDEDFILVDANDLT